LQNLKVLALGRREITLWVENSLYFTGSEVVSKPESPGDSTQIQQAGYHLVIVDSEIPELENLVFKLIWYYRLRVAIITIKPGCDWSLFKLMGVDAFLPLNIGKPELIAELSAVADRGKPIFPNLKGLLIEDDPHIREALKLCLHMFWPEIVLTTADNGQSGLEKFKTEVPDFILLDLGLPDITGFEVEAQVRTTSQIPILVLTARINADDIVKAVQGGANDYVIKPFSQIDLLLRVKKQILPVLAKHQYSAFRFFF
jgi:CheY-like chemotaxis protein